MDIKENIEKTNENSKELKKNFFHCFFKLLLLV